MTKLHVHTLTGLTPDALATYLAALGVLRLLAEQKDANIRGFWRDEHFVLISEHDWNVIEHFFVEDYTPTPILAPWNLESGFFSLKPTDGQSEEPDEAPDGGGGADAASTEDDDQAEEEDDRADQAVGDPLLDRFASTTARRFESFRRSIEIARAAIPDELRRAEKDARCVHDEISVGSDKERADHEAALNEISVAQNDVASMKAEVEAKKVAVKRVARGASEHGELKATQQRVKAAQEHLKNVKTTAKELEKKLNKAKTRAKADPQLKQRIAETKARFKAIQGETKDRLIGDLRMRWGSDGQQWVDAAVALDEKGEAGFTSIFGSGGNDGRMEYTKNLRYHLDALFDVSTGAARADAATRLNAALFGTPTNLLVGKPVGQFFPGRATDGTNMGAGFRGRAGINPWEFVLMLEGAVALVAGMSRRGDVEHARVSSPFWVEGAPAGFGSASEREGSLRGEQWLPVWSQPLRYGELVELIREGRAQIGRSQTTRAADLVRATARLGLARGIDSLQRFAYLQRNGQSNLAVSTGRFRVASRSHQSLLDEIAPWIDRLGWQAREKNAPTSLGVIARRTQEALFTVCRQEATATMWRELLVALGDAELVLWRTGKNPARRPLPGLSSGWLAAVDDGTWEGRTALRLALSLASQHAPRAPDDDRSTGERRHHVRQHFLPLIDSARFNLDDKGRTERDAEHVCVGRDLVTDAIALVERRSIWSRSASSKRDRTPRLPLEAVTGSEATLEEIAAWVRGEIADQAVLRLVRPLLALKWNDVALPGSGVPIECEGVPDPVQMLFRLAHLPFDIPVRGSAGLTVDVTVRLDPEPLRRLAAGDLDGALRVAIRRLDASGLRAVFRSAVATPDLTRRLAASLAFPISRNDAARAARLVCKPYDVKAAEELPTTTV